MIATKPSVLPVRFFIKQVKDDAQSRVEGREVLVPEEWKKIRVDTSTTVVGPVTDEDRERYALEYRAWREGLAAPGTPISVLVAECAKSAEPMMTDEAAVELEAQFSITTVEQVAHYPDGKFTYGHGRALQKKARELLERLKEEAVEAVAVRRENEVSAVTVRLAALEAENARLRQLIEGDKASPSHDGTAIEGATP